MKLISTKQAKKIWDENDGDPGEGLWLLSGEENEDGEPLFTTICPEDGFRGEKGLYFVNNIKRDTWIHDIGNARVVTEDDDIVFYTDKLDCDIEVVSHVVLLHNQNDCDTEELGSSGILDEYLLDAPCTQEDREFIVESIFKYLENK